MVFSICWHMKYKTYNEITKLFDVDIMNKTQINNLNNNPSFLVLTPRKSVTAPTRQPRRQRNAKAPAWFQAFVEQKFDPLIKRIDNLAKLNNLKE